MVCERISCKFPLTHGHYNIKNNNTDAGRNYCVACGRKIVELNPGIEYGVFDRNGNIVRSS
jgi:hypothetical protein